MRKITGSSHQRRSFLSARQSSVPLSLGISRSSRIRFGLVSSTALQKRRGSLSAVTAIRRRARREVRPRETNGSSSTTRIRRASSCDSSSAVTASGGVWLTCGGAGGLDAEGRVGGPSRLCRRARRSSEIETPSTGLSDRPANRSAKSLAVRAALSTPNLPATSATFCASRSAAAFNSAERLLSRRAIAASSSLSIF